MKKRILILCGILVLMAALSLLPAGATEPTTPQDIDFSAGGTVRAECPHCKEEVDWLPLTQEVADAWGNNYDPANGTHYYVSNDVEEKVTVATGSGVAVAAGEELCLHLNGKQVYRGGARAFGVSGTLNVFDHAANEGTIVGFANSSSTGCVVRLNSSGANFNLYGGTVQMKTGSHSKASAGGAVHCISGTTFTMYGGTLTGGIADKGGNLCVLSGGTANLLGGSIIGGEAKTTGGNVQIEGTLNLGNCAITGGTAATSGGDVYVAAAGKLHVKSGFAGVTIIALNAAHLPETMEGGNLADTLDSCEGPFSGKLYLESTEELVCLYGKEADTKLYTAMEEEDFTGTGAMAAKCRHCGKIVVWQPLDETVLTGWNKNYNQNNGTHYYLAKDSVTMSNGTLSIESGETLCLHLNGKALEGRITRAFYVYGTLNLMDHAANEGLLYAMAGSGTTGCVVRVNGTFNMYGGNVQMRTGTYSRGGNGGSIYIASDKTFNMYGGTVSGGIGENGGNIYVATGATCNLAGGTVSGGRTVKVDSSDGYGGNIYNNGTVILGNANVTGGTTVVLGSDIYSSATGQLTVNQSFAGNTYVAFNAAHLPTPVLGGNLADTLDRCKGPFTGKLYLENSSYKPTLYGVEGDTKLYIPDTALVKQNDTITWYGSASAAMEAYDSTVAYMLTGSGELVVDGGTYTVDVAGTDLAVSGSGTVTFFDSANQDYATYGTVTVTDVTVANTFETEVGGNKYYMIKEDNTYTFHCLKIALSGVSIRPSSSGIYYTGTWSCDEKMAELVDSFGVAVSLRQTPTESFATTSHCLYTEFAADELTSGTQKTGVIIEGILNGERTAALNNRYGRMPIYATAYLRLKDNGTVIISEKSADYSLYTAMVLMDKMIGENTEFAQENLSVARAFYEQWKYNGLGGWDLDNIPAPPPGEDGVLNLLMVGNSFCYYYVQELYELLMENPPEGIEEVNIYNLYYSGCRLDQHLTWWKNGTAKYELYKTDATGRNELNPETPWTLEQALVMENWDYISLQGMPTNGSYVRAEETQLHLSVAELAEPLLDRFHALHPEAQLLWHRTWYFEIGRVSGSTTYTEEMGVTYNAGMQFVCDYMCNEFDQDKPYDLIQVNSGAAWTLAREAEAGKNLLPFGGLCARLGITKYGDELAGYEGDTTHSGDGYHDGDIGGAQLLNAYVWYETLTGNDCRETVYRPVYTYGGTEYTLSEELVTILQNAAHEVVSGMPETVKPAS